MRPRVDGGFEEEADMSQPTRYCDSCVHFWVTDKSDTRHQGRCHRYPPVLVPANTIPVRIDEWAYPKVTASDACGEHSIRHVR